jgi:hypothetical protein
MSQHRQILVVLSMGSKTGASQGLLGGTLGPLNLGPGLTGVGRAAKFASYSM